MRQTFKISISGQVQGVGFRPFVHNLAKRLKLKGSVCNNEHGVLVLVNGSQKKAREFLESILRGSPKISDIQSYDFQEVPFKEFSDFEIIPSHAKHQIDIPLTPDFAICELCKSEIRDVNNRRYGYAFTTCTNCGPRYAITTKFPFERANTTVAAFKMCHNCKEEYDNPSDKRFHSQTNSCPSCGIELKLNQANGEQIKANQSRLIEKAADLIKVGNIIAIKSTNGYLLCCDANNKLTIERLREKKQRPSKPFALLYPSIEKIKTDFVVTDSEKEALLSATAPIVILNPKRIVESLEQESIAPGLNQLGVMLPSSALLAILMEHVNFPIVATSGNIHGSPIISEERDAVQKLSGVANYFLHHNLDIVFPQDDSVIKCANGQRIILRRSRGLAPNYRKNGNPITEKILAMGAHLKSTFSFLPNSHIYCSQYFGNLDNYDVSMRFLKSIEQFESLFETNAQTIIVDSHPQYQSSILGRELADKWNAKLFEVQHQEAHFASVLGEHDLFNSEEKILGVVWDGTGLGRDNAIWGGEFFLYYKRSIQRLTHFEYVDWIASDKMAKEPRLSLLSMLPESEREIIKNKFSDTEWKVYNKMLTKNFLKTSSVGRLFDAVASLLGIIDSTTYEGEAAMLLESYAREYKGNDPIDFLDGLDFQVIPTRILIKNLAKAFEKETSIELIASSFIHTMAWLIVKMAEQKRVQNSRM